MKDHQLPIAEIFYSLRGEGHWTGSAATFVRLATCNLACPFCDTEFNRFSFIHFDEVLRYAKNTPSPWIVFTGGEPTLHDSRIAEFQEYVAEKGHHFKYHLETNGTGRIEIADFDWITCSPKVGYTAKKGGDTPWEALSNELLSEANEFKMIQASWAPALEDTYKMLKLSSAPEAEFYAQPWSNDLAGAHDSWNRQKAIEFCLAHPEVRLSLQTHKYLGVR